nr:hypothetical protein [uncultured Mucilaginibacter sp.]
MAGFIKDGVKSIVEYLVNPVLFISLVGPTLMEINLELMDNQHSHLNRSDKFNSLLSNEYNYALNAYNIQLFVLILSIIFAVIETVKAFYQIGNNYPILKLKHAIHNSVPTMGIIFLAFVLTFLFCKALLSGSFASEEIVSMYLKSNENKIGDFLGVTIPLPPFESLLTKYRIVIFIYGVLFLVWEKKGIPDLKRKLATTDRKRGTKQQ